MKKRFFPFALILIVLLSLISLVVSYFLFRELKNTKQELTSIKKDPQAFIQTEAKQLVAKVGKLIDLPQEEPTVATIANLDQLKNQPFFAKAKIGDKILIFSAAKKAILYDPTANKIIEVGPLLDSNQAAEPVVTSSPQAAPVTITLYNGTSISGLTSQAETKLRSKLPSLTVVDKISAQKKTYAKTLVVDLSGTKSTQAKDIANILNGEVGPLPVDEKSPVSSDSAKQVDILAIIGSDFTK